MTIEINIGSARKQPNESNMGSKENLDFLRKKQLANEMRYSIGELDTESNHDLSSKDSVGNAILRRFVNEHTGMENKLNRLIESNVESLRKRLIEHWKTSRPQNWSEKVLETKPGNDSWNTIMMWDRKVKCPGKGCNAYVTKTPASNDVNLWKKARIVMEKITNSSEIFSLKNRTIDVLLLRRKIYSQHKFIDAELSSKFGESELRKMQKQDISTYNAMLYTNLCLEELDSCQSCGKDLFPHTPTITENNNFFETVADLTIRKIVTTIAGSMLSTSSKKYIGIVDNFQLPEQNGSISLDVLESINNLDELTDELNKLHEKRKDSEINYKINTQDKVNDLDDKIKEIKSNLMSRLLNGELDSQLQALIDSRRGVTENEDLFIEVKNRIKGKVSFSAGKISDYNFAIKRHQGIISSCIQQGLNFGDFTVNQPNGAKIIVKQCDNLTVEQLQVTSATLIDAIANELVKLKPMAFFSEQNTEFPAAAQTKWAKRIAVQLLYLVKGMEGFLRFQKVHQDELNNSEKKFDNKIWLIRFSKVFKLQFSKEFNENEAMSSDYVRKYFNTMRFEPMLCPPDNRTASLSSGGYLSESARRKTQLISNNLPEHNFNITRFNPSQKAIDSLNKLQQTPWKINERVARVAYECLREKVSDFFDNIEFSTEYYGIVANYKEDFPEFDGGQLSEWMETLSLAGWYVDESIDNFWHAWQFDWRGRMYPCSTLLTPQDDDVARGLLLFDGALPINDEGWKWLKRMIGRAYRGREICVRGQDENGMSKILNNGFTDEEIKTWTEIQKQLKSKKWSDIDKVFDGKEKESLIEKVAQRVALDPYETQTIWAENDIFVKKCEGFQRLAVTLEYNSANEQKELDGDKPILISFPLVLDASSNVYQHASRLTGDVKMAESVNVLPNENSLPADVYTKVANEVANLIDKDNDGPFADLNLTQDELEVIKSFCTNRGTAKGPVMTIGYGATDWSMVPKFLTHNGETNGITSWVYNNISENKIISARRYYNNKNYLLDIPLEDLKRIKDEISEDEYKERKKILESAFKSAFDKKMVAHPVSKFAKAIKDNNAPTLIEKELLHHEIASIISAQFKKAIKKVLPGHNKLKESLELVRKVNSDCLEASNNYTSWYTIDGCFICNIRFQKNKLSAITPWKVTLTTEERKQIEHKVKLTFSANIPNDERNPTKEGTALPPNFVHSIDATHMRLFVDKISNLTENIWSVHDAFGIHPNFGDSLLRYGTQTFFEAHDCKDAGSKLNELVDKSLNLVSEVEHKGAKVPSAESVDELKGYATKLTSSKDNVDITKLGIINKDNLKQEGKIEYNNIDDLLVINYDELYLLS